MDIWSYCTVVECLLVAIWLELRLTQLRGELVYSKWKQRNKSKYFREYTLADSSTPDQNLKTESISGLSRQIQYDIYLYIL